DVNAAQDLFNVDAHGLADGDEIRFALTKPANTLPVPLHEGVYYFVVNSSTNQFQISTTLGGPVLPLNNSGTGNATEIWKVVSGIPSSDTRPWAGLGFDAWNAQPPLEGESPTGKHFIASPSYRFIVHFEVEPDQPES